MSLKIPNHIAIVMDGNGRWAQKRGYPRIFGHIRGSARVRLIVRAASELGVKALTLYAFSTENWSRPEGERSVLWRLLKKHLLREADELQRQNVRLRVIGEVERLDPDLQKVVSAVVDKLKNNTGLQLTFAVSYGSRSELVRAAQLFSQDCLQGIRTPSELTESVFERYLWTSVLGDLAAVDLFVRTSGERRMSNFLLWQSAYAECVFIDTCWPDFGPHHLRGAIEEYSKRERRFGGVSAQGPEFTSPRSEDILLK